MMSRYWIVALVAFVLPGLAGAESAPGEFLSHRPARPLPAASERPLEGGEAKFVDPARGNDASSGSEAKPWRTLAHAVMQLRPGDTLVLRGGLYYEHVTANLVGTIDKPITIRAYPGELVILDGSLREFFDQPNEVWESCSAGVAGEFQSKRAFPALQVEGDGPAVFGNFGDS